MNTAELREPQKIIEVDFHGATIQIAHENLSTFWLAADKNGDVWFYEYRPRLNRLENGFSFTDCMQNILQLAKINLNGIDWRDTPKEYRF